MEKDYIQLKKYVLSREGDFVLKKLDKAWDFVKRAHQKQKRLTGEPYANHPLQTALILTDWKLDSVTIIAALLHDTVEDAKVEIKEIQKLFGREIVLLVSGVTKVSKVKLKGSQEEEFVENLRKMFLAMAKDLRVVLVKLADRMHNLRTLYALDKKRRERIARETLEVYAPLAERLGMGEVKGELEDLSFFYLYPEQNKKVKDLSKPFYKQAEKDIRRMKQKILKRLIKEGIKAKIQGRKKHLYSLWLKLDRPEIGWDFHKIHDIVALRIIVDDLPQCYSALGIIHQIYKPVPNIGVSDFIAQPKPNGYRSIHTKVFSNSGRIVEIQIRTEKMHKEAEYGIAAHWSYSEAKGKKLRDALLEAGRIFSPEKKINWVRQLADWQKEITNTQEFIEVVKFDALKHRNFVFSPLGDVYDLPAGATPVDFAYAVHTDLGKQIAGARVDGRIVPLNYKLKSGQLVEIIKQKKAKGANAGWLDFVVTTLARREIKRETKK